MVTRANIKTQIAYHLAEQILFYDAYERHPLTFERVERQNGEGWNVDTRGGLGSTLRHEGVRLDDDELRAVWERAQEIARDQLAGAR